MERVAYLRVAPHNPAQPPLVQAIMFLELWVLSPGSNICILFDRGQEKYKSAPYW